LNEEIVALFRHFCEFFRITKMPFFGPWVNTVEHQYLIVASLARSS